MSDGIGADSRDIDMVLLTGAGASCLMGDPPFPTMKEWRKSLQAHLTAQVPWFADLVDLNEDIDGPEFERRLGRFLREAYSFTESEDLVARSIELPFVATSLNSHDIGQWRLQLSNALSRLLHEIYQSAFDQFGRSNLYKMSLAEKSYGELLSALGIRSDESTLVYATTNYDYVGEITLSTLGYHPFPGDERSPINGSRFRLNARRLGGFASPDRTPVFHLHGSVGWFIDKDGTSYGLDSVSQYDESMGLPIVLLPNIEKDYQSIPLIVDLWSEFRSTLRRAKAVFVLGHSLNDGELCRVLGEDVRNGSRVAVVQPTPNSVGPLRDDDEEELSAKLGLTGPVTIVPLVFGRGHQQAMFDALDLWQKRLNSVE